MTHDELELRNKYAHSIMHELQQEVTDRECELKRIREDILNSEKTNGTVDSNESDTMTFIDILKRERDEKALLFENSNYNKAALEIAELKKRLAEIQADSAEMNRRYEIDLEIEKNIASSTQYVKVEDSSEERFAMLVTKAIGDKSMRQFAEEIGVNVSSLSRIINQKNKGQCSVSMIAAIAANADPRSNVTFDGLMRALGRRRRFGMAHFDENAKNIIISGLLTQGYTISMNTPERFQIPGGEFHFDLSLITGSNHETCNYIVVSSFANNTEDRVYKTLSTIMNLYYLGRLKNAKSSIVVTDKDAFRIVKNNLSRISVKDDISIVLIESNRIKEEWYLKKEKQC